MLTWFKQNAEIESCSLWMILTGSGRLAVAWSVAVVAVLSLGRGDEGISITDVDFLLPNTQRINISCTGSCLTRKLQSRRAGAADQCLGL